MPGVSIANNLLANQIQYNVNTNQASLSNMTKQLSSGLRINSAADDPSGLAIATNLQTQVAGFDAAVQNVQAANNAAQVALGALTTTTDILQRIRTLAVEASSDLNSNADRGNLQTEVSQLLLEINRIAQNTNFNGLSLLDGSHAGFQPQQNASATVVSNAALASGTSASLTVTAPTLNVTGPGSGFETVSGLVPGGKYTLSGAGFSSPGSGFAALANGSFIGGGPGGTSVPLTGTITANALGQVLISGNIFGVGTLSMTGLTLTPLPGTVSPTIQAGYLVASISASNTNFNTTVGAAIGYATTAVSSYGTIDGSIELQVVNTGASIAVQETFINSATGAISVDSTLFAANSVAADFENVSVTIGSVTSQDVGVTAYIKISQNVAALTNPTAPALNFQSGANEGDVIQVGLQATNTQTLRVSNINLAISSPTNPYLGAEDAIGQVDVALQLVLSQQAQLGAVVVQLNEEAKNDSISAVNLQASESQIRDLNVGQATTQFTRLQVLIQVGTSVLSQANTNSASVLALFR